MFPKWVQLGGGGNVGKLTKNCMKITKATVLGQNSGEGHEEGQANFLGGGGVSPSPPNRGNPRIWSCVTL